MIRKLFAIGAVVASAGVPELAFAASLAAPDATVPLGTQVLVSVSLMGVAGGFLLWDGLVSARKRRQLRAARASAPAGKG